MAFKSRFSRALASRSVDRRRSQRTFSSHQNTFRCFFHIFRLVGFKFAWERLSSDGIFVCYGDFYYSVVLDIGSLSPPCGPPLRAAALNMSVSENRDCRHRHDRIRNPNAIISSVNNSKLRVWKSIFEIPISLRHRSPSTK
jgi:hypothetical protein